MQFGAGLGPTVLGVGAGTAVGAVLATPLLAHKLGDDPASGISRTLESAPARAVAGVAATLLLPGTLTIAASGATEPIARTALLGAAMGVEMGWWGTRSLEELAPGT